MWEIKLTFKDGTKVVNKFKTFEEVTAWIMIKESQIQIMEVNSDAGSYNHRSTFWS